MPQTHWRRDALAWAALAALVLASAPAAAQELVWHGPDEGHALAPVPLLYAIHGSGGAYVGHVNVPLTVTLDGGLLFSTPSVHEHDGVHGFLLSAPQAGTLVARAEPGGLAAAQHIVPLAPASGHAGHPPFPDAYVHSDGASATPAVGEPGSAAAWVLAEALDGDGRLRVATWQAPGEPITLERDGAWRPHALFFAAPGSSAAAGARLVTGEEVRPGLRLPDVLGALDRLLSGTLPLCSQAGADVILDPNSPSDGGGAPTWQEHSTVRTAWIDHGKQDLRWTVVQEAGLAAAPVRLAFPSLDPHGQAAFTVDGPGTYVLIASWREADGDERACRIPFQVTANAAPPGRVEHDIEVDEPAGTARITFTPLSAQGLPLPHYEFDTRVVLLADEHQSGRLVYAGKLHGHGGTVEFTLGMLPAGEYLVWTHPSPQDQETAPLAADGFDGFVYAFSMPPGPATYHGGGSNGTPLSLLPVLATLAAAARLAATRPRRDEPPLNMFEDG